MGLVVPLAPRLGGGILLGDHPLAVRLLATDLSPDRRGKRVRTIQSAKQWCVTHRLSLPMPLNAALRSELWSTCR